MSQLVDCWAKLCGSSLKNLQTHLHIAVMILCSSELFSNTKILLSIKNVATHFVSTDVTFLVYFFDSDSNHKICY